MNEDGGSTDAPSVVNLWGICALTGSHNGLGPCANHVPCDCATPGVKHVRFHPQCIHCDPIKQRSEVWPALTGLVPHGNISFVAATESAGGWAKWAVRPFGRRRSHVSVCRRHGERQLSSTGVCDAAAAVAVIAWHACYRSESLCVAGY